DQYQNLSSFNGNKTITFGGLTAAPDGSLGAVNGTALGTGTTISFTSGTGAATTLVAHKVESSKLLTAASSTPTLTAAQAGGTAPTLSPTVGAASAYRLTGTGSPQVGVNYTVNVALVDQFQNVSSFAGGKTLTFDAAMSAGAD